MIYTPAHESPWTSDKSSKERVEKVEAMLPFPVATMIPMGGGLVAWLKMAMHHSWINTSKVKSYEIILWIWMNPFISECLSGLFFERLFFVPAVRHDLSFLNVQKRRFSQLVFSNSTVTSLLWQPLVVIQIIWPHLLPIGSPVINWCVVTIF